jgi:hypothetical protein
VFVYPEMHGNREPPAKMEVHMAGITDIEDASVLEPSPQMLRIRPRSSRILSEVEMELTRLYLRLLDEPVPSRLIGILRAGLTTSKG